jgi:hypothetical protein
MNRNPIVFNTEFSRESILSHLLREGLSLDISHGPTPPCVLRSFRPARVFKDTGGTQPSLRDEVGWRAAYPALKYRAKVITSLRDEERRRSRGGELFGLGTAGESETHRSAGGRAAGRR